MCDGEDPRPRFRGSKPFRPPPPCLSVRREVGLHETEPLVDPTGEFDEDVGGVRIVRLLGTIFGRAHVDTRAETRPGVRRLR